MEEDENSSKLVVFFAVLIIIFISFIGALISDYVFHAHFTLLTFIVIIVISLILGILSKIFLNIPIPYILGFILGIILIPYVQFFVGGIDIYVTDSFELRESVSVNELRISLDNLNLINDRGEKILILKNISEKVIPKNNTKVYIGKLKIPIGYYDKGYLNLKNIEIDSVLDVEKEADIQAAIAKSISSTQNKEQIKSLILNSFSQENIKKYETQYIHFKNVKIQGSKVYFTLSITPSEIQMPFPVQIPYPLGMGGPDMTINLILNSFGYPTSIKPILDFPIGIPEVSLGNLAEFPEYNLNILQKKEISSTPPTTTPPITPPTTPPTTTPPITNPPSTTPPTTTPPIDSGFGIGPGGCLSVEECLDYCSIPENEVECTQYIESQGFDVSGGEITL
ncbi:MAG: hypothetical protein Q7S33_04975 [Nanoarchaeota archaeon]|nr:hypothetical protein [Nanoarchaeota archaeon]